MRKRGKVIVRIFIFVILFFVVFVPLSLFILLRIPSVQKYTLSKVNSTLSDKFQSKVEIQRIVFDYPDKVKLKNIYIEDKNKDTLLYAKELIVQISWSNLFRKKISISDLKVDEAKLNVYRKMGQKDFNFLFIAEALNDSSDNKSSWKFDLKNITLESVKVRYNDLPGGLSINSSIGLLDVKIKDLGIDNHDFVVSRIRADQLLLALCITSKDSSNVSKKAQAELKKYIVKDFSLKRSRFIYRDYTQSAQSAGLDFNRLHVDSLQASFKDVSIGDLITFDVKSFSGKDSSGFAMKELEGQFSIKSNEWLSINKLKIRTPYSHVDGPLNLKFPLSENVDFGELYMDGKFDDESIAVGDLSQFFKGLDTISILKDRNIKISGDVSGKVKDFLFQDFSISLDENNFVQGSIDAQGLPNIPNAYLDIDLKRLELDSSILSYLNRFGDSLANFKSMGNLHLQGSIKGKLSRPLVDASVVTRSGSISLDGVLKLNKDFSFEGFTGGASIKDLNLGKLFPGLEQFGKVTLKASVDTYNSDLNSIDATIAELNFNNTSYRNIKLKGSKRGEVLDLKGQIADSNALSHFNLQADLKNNHYKGNGEVEELNLHSMNITSSQVKLKTDFKVNLSGKNIDSLRGNVLFSNIQLSDAHEKFDLDSLQVKSEINDAYRELTIASDSVHAVLKGDFLPSELPLIFHVLSNKYLHPKEDSVYKRLKSNYFDFTVQTGNVSKPLSFVIPGIQFLEGVNGKGSFNRLEETFTVDFAANDFEGWDSRAHNPFVKISSNRGEMNFKVGAEGIKGDNLVIEEPLITGSLINDSIKFTLKMYDENAPTRLNMSGLMKIDNDKYWLSFTSAQIFIQNREWDLDSENRIVFGKNILHINDLEFSQGNQRIVVNSNGRIGTNNAEVLFKDVQLNELAEIAGLSNYQMNGTVNGYAQIRDFFSNLYVNNVFKVDSFVLSNFKLGTLELNVFKSSVDDFLNVEMKLSNDSSNTKVNGKYFLEKKGRLDFDVKIAKLPLQAFESFAKDVFNKLRGDISGDLHVSGLSSNPQITGLVRLNGRNEVNLTLTNTTYRIVDEKILFKENEIVVDHFKVLDSLGNNADIDGSISYTSFDNFIFDLEFKTNKFGLVNSISNREGLVHGKLITKMDVKIKGPMKDFNVNFNLKTLKGTNLTFALVQSQIATESPSFIHYRPIQSTINQDSIETNKVASDNSDDDSDELNFNVYGKIIVNKDAKLNMIVDPINGDKVTSVGEAELTLDFDSYYNMNLVGTYTIDTGSYSFSFGKVIKRDFGIEKGSVISWSGEPEEATVDIIGIYQTRAARNELVADQSDFMSQSQLDAARRRLPVDVYLYFKGPVLNPEISFDIKIPEGSDVMNGNLVVQELNQMKQNPGELNKQVFSLILTNRFTGQTTSNGIIPTSNLAFDKANQSVSNMLTSFLNSYGGTIRGFDVNVNFESLDQSYGRFAQNAQVMVSKSLNTRVSVSAGGNINLNSNYSSGQFAGDYSVRYRLNHSGSVNLNFFRSSFQNIYSSSIYYNQGFSMNFQRNFNEWKYIFGKSEHD